MKKVLITILFSLLIAPLFTFSQDKSEAILVDDFGNIPCGDILARMDMYIAYLQERPGSKGYVIINGDKNNQRKILFREVLLKGSIEFRVFDKNRITFKRGDKKDSIRTKLWVILDGAETPKFKNVKYEFPLDKSAKPFIFMTFDNIGYCPFAEYEKAYIEVLESNPKAKGHIVIYEKSNEQFEITKSKLIKSLSEIELKRLRFFYVKRENENIEYWIVPKKKRN